MFKAGIDQDAISKMFSQASVKQGDALRKAVSEATLKALQGRELTMGNVRKVLKSVTAATTVGAAQNIAAPMDVEAMLTKAFAGMDGALLQAVQAHHKALQQFVDQGTGLHEKQLKGAIANIENMEDTFYETVTKASQVAGGPIQKSWEHVLEAMKIKGTHTGVHAAETIEELMARTRSMVRDNRAANAKTAQAMLDSYAALVSGVLIGMADGLQSGSRPAAASVKSKK